MKKIISAAGLVILASTATAQISNFEGVSAAVNLNSVNSNVKFSSYVANAGLGEQSNNASVQAAYGMALSPQAVVSFGVGYGLGKSKSGTVTFFDDVIFDDVILDGVILDGVTLAFEVKDQLSIYLEPGFLINSSTLLYGKVSYERAKAVIKLTGDPDESRTVKGTGIGFGIRTMLNKSSFIQVEVRQINFKSINEGTEFTAKPKANVATIGFGLKF